MHLFFTLILLYFINLLSTYGLISDDDEKEEALSLYNEDKEADFNDL